VFFVFTYIPSQFICMNHDENCFGQYTLNEQSAPTSCGTVRPEPCRRDSHDPCQTM
jgi:hypothetical protein